MKPFFSFFYKKYTQIKNFFVEIPDEDESILTLEELTLQNIELDSYINFDLTIEEKIEREKRRRHQAYMTLDYLISVVSYFDFFSLDTFQIAIKAKELSQFFNKKIVNSEFLLLPFFEFPSDLLQLLEKYGITEKNVSENLSNSNPIDVGNESFFVKQKNKIKKLLINLDIPMLSEALIVPKRTKFSNEINFIFEKAAENALTRFKTPVISPEILLITMLESKKSKIGKLLKQFLKNDTNWHTFRYSLMKRLHTQELRIRTDVPKNQQYFAYLLKTQLSEIEFATLLDKNCLESGVSIFRNALISKVIKVDLATILTNEVKTSLKKNKVRKYSSEN